MYKPKTRVTYDRSSIVYNNRLYRPYANKKSYYMHRIARLNVGQSIIVDELSNFTLRSDWIGRITHKTNLKYKIQELDVKVHKVTRII